jgi:hypothetical protein
MLKVGSEQFRSAVERVARELVATDHREGYSLVSTPLRYPGGASVVIRIADAQPDFFVTDFGIGYEESEMMGGSAIFARHAPSIAETCGIGFDQHSFFIVKASKEQLPAAIVTVANCSQEAVVQTAFKLAERRVVDETERLYTRLTSVFRPQRVARDAEVVGRSNTKWHVATLVKSRNTDTIFEPVSNHHTSVFAASTKFRDIAGAEGAPQRVAMVRNRNEFGTHLSLLSENAHVIQRDVPDRTIVHLARAA